MHGRERVRYFVANTCDHEAERGEALRLRVDRLLFRRLVVHAARIARRLIGCSSIGTHSAAASTDSAIDASHTGRYEPVRSKTAPPIQAPKKEPSWWPRNAIEKSVDRYLTPKICATSELVSGTVPSHVDPTTAAKTYRLAALNGSVMNAVIATARIAYIHASTSFLL